MTMFSSQIVCAIKVNGKVLRENGDTVTLPFGAEYSVLIKNLSSVRTQFSLAVDGQDATEGTRLIVAPNSSLELERFIKGGNLSAGNRFRFIERTASIEQHRGVGAEDGLIRVEAWCELVQAPVIHQTTITHHYDNYHYPWVPPYRGPYYGTTTMSGTVMDSATNTAGNFAGSIPPPKRPSQPTSRHAAPQMRGPGGSSRSHAIKPPRADMKASLGPLRSKSLSDVGITVAGSESRQQFHMVNDFPVESQSVVLVLRLRGEIGGQPVAAPVTVNAKLVCDTCGKANKAGGQFCSACGAALQVYA